MKMPVRSSFLFAFLTALIWTGSVVGQSTNQNFPTPVTSSEISGTIKARDVGDARLTSYYYQFDGDQGDVFINVVARNFTGDIDVFTLNGLRPITKIVLFADANESETGRVIYLRKPEKMILRVQGRTPGDDPAMFRIKFAGSFVASTMTEPAAEPALPSLTAKNESGIRVNSVGTIVEVIPKATPTPTAVESASAAEAREKVDETAKEQSEVAAEKPTEDKPVDGASDAPDKKLAVVVTEGVSENTNAKPVTPPARRRARGRVPAKSAPSTGAARSGAPPASTSSEPVATARRRGRAVPGKTPPEKVPDPLANVNLIILFKDGTAIERPMSEVLRFSVDRGVLTVISKDGSIGKYSILDVSKVTIQ